MKRNRRTQGHRQNYMYLLVTDIQAKGKSLVSADERKRYEDQAARMAKRYEARLLGVPAGADGDEAEAAVAE